MVSLPEFIGTPQPSLHTQDDALWYQMGRPGHAFANRARRAANLPAQQASAAALNDMSLQAFLSEQTRERESDALSALITGRDSLSNPASAIPAAVSAAPGSLAQVIAGLRDPAAEAATNSAIQAERVSDASGSGPSLPDFTIEPGLPGMPPAITIEGSGDAQAGLDLYNSLTGRGGQQPISGGSIADQATTTNFGNVDTTITTAAEHYRSQVGGELAAGNVELEDQGVTVPAVVVRTSNGEVVYFYTDPATGEGSYQVGRQ